MRRHLHLVVAAAVVVAAGCADPSTPAPPPQATSTALPTPAPPSPSASPSPTDVPTPTAPASPDPTTSPSPSPSPSAAPPDQAEALAAARQRRAEREDCDEFADEFHEVVTATGDTLLVHVVCFVGAYQTNGELRLFDGEQLQPLTVEQWQFGEVVDTPEVVGFVEASGDGTTVFNDVKYRGLGDCGLTQTWSFDGSALLLQEARERECSDDEEFVPPDQWPLVYER